MRKQKEKLPDISSEHRQSLAELYANVHFKSLLQLFSIEENNIIVQTFKIPSSDPELARKKSWQEGRLYEIRKIIKTFDECRKRRDDK